jgi:hypothetical protein
VHTKGLLHACLLRACAERASACVVRFSCLNMQRMLELEHSVLASFKRDPQCRATLQQKQGRPLVVEPM